MLDPELQQNVYDDFADEYAQGYVRDPADSFNFNLDLVIPRLLQIAGKVDGLSVLDAGCGEGIVSRSLIGTAQHLVGVDLSPRLIAYARTRDVTQRIVYEIHDLTRPVPHYQEAFDLVVSNMVLNDVLEYTGFIATISSVLKPQGRFVASMNNPYSAVLREKVDNYFDSGKLTQYGFGPAYYVHRTMEEYLAACQAAGLWLRQLYDVQMTSTMVARLPEKHQTFPWFSWYDRFPFIVILELVKGPR